MERFTFYKEYYDTIQRLKKPQDRAYLSLAVMQYIFEDKIPENLSDAAEMAFEILLPKLSKSKNNSGRGGRPKTKTELQNGFQKSKPNCKTVSNRFSKTETERKTVSLEKESTKEKDISLKKENERKKETYINTHESAHTHEGNVDFSALSVEELAEWMEKTNLDMTTEEGIALYMLWQEEIERRKPKWEGKIVYDGTSVRLKSHEEVMEDSGASPALKTALRDFLRHCYINRHLVSNEKLERIIARLADVFTDDEAMKCDCVYKAINGGYFDIGVK